LCNKVTKHKKHRAKSTFFLARKLLKGENFFMLCIKKLAGQGKLCQRKKSANFLFQKSFAKAAVAERQKAATFKNLLSTKYINGACKQWF
jgi:hypothetical protein